MRKDYDTLGIEENADEKAIKKAYFKLVKQYSPEKDPERFQEIREAYERLMAAGEQPENSISLEFPVDDKFARSMFDQIQQLMQEQDYDKAVKTAAEGCKYYKDAECFLYMYARCSLLNSQAGNAVKAYEKLLKRYPEKVYYMSELAKAYNMRGYMRKAYAMFQQAYANGARDTEFLFEYVAYCGRKRKYEEALQVLGGLLDSIPPEKMEQKIPELLQAYCELFSLYVDIDFEIEPYVDRCDAFLRQAGSRVSEYEDLMMILYLVVREVAMQLGGDEIEAFLERIRQLAPAFDDEDDPVGDEAYELLEDDRFSELTKYTVEVLALLDEMDFPGESFDQYMMFMQMDITLCNLEIWPKQRKELELMRTEYPDLYECGAPLWEILHESKGQKSYMIDSMMAEYSRMRRMYDCGRYLEFYPEKRQNIEQIQWDSLGSGTYVRQGKKIGRNDPCPCGSGKKYKNCCGKGA